MLPLAVLLVFQAQLVASIKLGSCMVLVHKHVIGSFMGLPSVSDAGKETESPIHNIEKGGRFLEVAFS